MAKLFDLTGTKAQTSETTPVNTNTGTQTPASPTQRLTLPKNTEAQPTTSTTPRLTLPKNNTPSVSTSAPKISYSPEEMMGRLKSANVQTPFKVSSGTVTPANTTDTTTSKRTSPSFRRDTNNWMAIDGTTGKSRNRREGQYYEWVNQTNADGSVTSGLWSWWDDNSKRYQAVASFAQDGKWHDRPTMSGYMQEAANLYYDYDEMVDYFTNTISEMESTIKSTQYESEAEKKADEAYVASMKTNLAGAKSLRDSSKRLYQYMSGQNGYMDAYDDYHTRDVTDGKSYSETYKSDEYGTIPGGRTPEEWDDVIYGLNLALANTPDVNTASAKRSSLEQQIAQATYARDRAAEEKAQMERDNLYLTIGRDYYGVSGSDNWRKLESDLQTTLDITEDAEERKAVQDKLDYVHDIIRADTYRTFYDQWSEASDDELIARILELGEDPDEIKSSVEPIETQTKSTKEQIEELTSQLAKLDSLSPEFLDISRQIKDLESKAETEEAEQKEEEVPKEKTSAELRKEQEDAERKQLELDAISYIRDIRLMTGASTSLSNYKKEHPGATTDDWIKSVQAVADEKEQQLITAQDKAAEARETINKLRFRLDFAMREAYAEGREVTLDDIQTDDLDLLGVEIDLDDLDKTERELYATVDKEVEAARMAFSYARQQSQWAEAYSTYDMTQQPDYKEKVMEGWKLMGSPEDLKNLFQEVREVIKSAGLDTTETVYPLWAWQEEHENITDDDIYDIQDLVYEYEQGDSSKLDEAKELIRELDPTVTDDQIDRLLTNEPETTTNDDKATELLTDYGFSKEDADALVKKLKTHTVTDEELIDALTPFKVDDGKMSFSELWDAMWSPAVMGAKKEDFSTEQLANYYYILATQGLDAATNYALRTNNQLTSEYRDEMRKKMALLDDYRMDNATGFEKGLRYVSTPWVTGLMNLTGVIDTIKYADQVKHLGDTIVGSAPSLSEASEWMTEDVNRQLTRDGAGKIVTFFYNAYGSAVQSLEAMAAGSAIADFLGITESMVLDLGLKKGISAHELITTAFTDLAFFGSASSSRYRELIDQGIDPERAMNSAIVSGICEAAFEHISIENLYHAKDVADFSGIGDVILETIIGSGIEGSEEVCTELANFIADQIMLGVDSDFFQSIEAYKNQGFSESEAYGKAIKDFAYKVGEAGAAGFVSGGMSIGPRTTQAYVRDHVTTKSYNTARGNTYLKNTYADGRNGGAVLGEFLSEYDFFGGKSSGNFTEEQQDVFDTIKDLASKAAKGHASAEEIGRMVSLADSIDTKIIDDFMQANRDYAWQTDPGRVLRVVGNDLNTLLGVDRANAYIEAIGQNPNSFVADDFVKGYVESDSSADQAEAVNVEQFLQQVLSGNGQLNADAISEEVKKWSNPKAQLYILTFLGNMQKRGTETAQAVAEGSESADNSFAFVVDEGLNQEGSIPEAGSEEMKNILIDGLTNTWEKAVQAAADFRIMNLSLTKLREDVAKALTKDATESENTSDETKSGTSGSTNLSDYRNDGDTLTFKGRKFNRREYVASIMEGKDPLSGEKVTPASESEANESFDMLLTRASDDSFGKDDNMSASMVDYDLEKGEPIAKAETAETKEEAPKEETPKENKPRRKTIPKKKAEVETKADKAAGGNKTGRRQTGRVIPKKGSTKTTSTAKAETKVDKAAGDNKVKEDTAPKQEATEVPTGTEQTAEEKELTGVEAALAAKEDLERIEREAWAEENGETEAQTPEDLREQEIESEAKEDESPFGTSDGKQTRSWDDSFQLGDETITRADFVSCYMEGTDPLTGEDTYPLMQSQANAAFDRTYAYAMENGGSINADGKFSADTKKATTTDVQQLVLENELNALESVLQNKRDAGNEISGNLIRIVDKARQRLQRALGKNITKLGSDVEARRKELNDQLKAIDSRMNQIRQYIKNKAIGSLIFNKELDALKGKRREVKARLTELNTSLAAYNSAVERLDDWRNRMYANDYYTILGGFTYGESTSTDRSTGRTDDVGNRGSSGSADITSSSKTGGTETEVGQTQRRTARSVEEVLSQAGLNFKGTVTFDSAALTARDIFNDKSLPKNVKTAILHAMRNGVSRIIITDGNLTSATGQNIGGYTLHTSENGIDRSIFILNSKAAIPVYQNIRHEYLHHMLGKLAAENRRRFLQTAIDIMFKGRPDLFQRVYNTYLDDYVEAYNLTLDADGKLDAEHALDVYEEMVADMYAGILRYTGAGDEELNMAMAPFVLDMQGRVFRLMELTGLEDYSRDKWIGEDHKQNSILDIEKFTGSVSPMGGVVEGKPVSKAIADETGMLVDSITVPNSGDGPEIMNVSGDRKISGKYSVFPEYNKTPKQTTELQSDKTIKTTKVDENGNLVEQTVRELRDEAFHNNKEFMAEQGEAGVNKFNSFLDKVADWLTNTAAQKFRYLNFEDINQATLKVDPVSNQIILSSMVNNGEYAVNIDFGTICERRQALQTIMNELLEGAAYDKSGIGTVQLNATTIHKINEALRDAGINTQCLICFVETKRYSQAKQFSEFVEMWNTAVKKYAKNPEHFDFRKGVKDLSAEEIEGRRKALAGYSPMKMNGKTLNTKQAVEEFVKRLAENSPNDLKLLDINDIISSKGRTNITQTFPMLNSLIMKKGGSSAPKPVYGYIPYNGEIESIEDKVGSQSLRDYIKSIAGVRSQSFSDFIITHVFDHLQKTGAMAARGLVAHTYTKVLARAKLFGLTGEKINMSLLFDINPNISSWYAGLSEETQDIDFSKNSGRLGVENARNRPYNFTDYRAKMEGKTEWVQSFPYDQAVEIQNTPIYSKNTGTIGVSHSYWHTMWMLADPEIRQVIGYHSSSYPAEIKQATRLDRSADYTGVQNNTQILNIARPNYEIPKGTPSYATEPGDVEKLSEEAKYIRLSEDEVSGYFGEYATGTTVDLSKMLKDALADETNKGKSKGEVAYEVLQNFLNTLNDNGLTLVTTKADDGHGKFKLYNDVEQTQNPYETMDNYIAFCLNEGKLPAFYEFTTDPNYYKLIFDFNVFDRQSYNPETGLYEVYAPQETVRVLDENGELLFPNKGDIIDALDHYATQYDNEQHHVYDFINDESNMEYVREVTGAKASVDTGKYSIETLPDGTQYVWIDSNIVSEANRNGQKPAAYVRNYIENVFEKSGVPIATTPDGHMVYAEEAKRTPKSKHGLGQEFAYSSSNKKLRHGGLFDRKLRSATNLDEIIAIAQNPTVEETEHPENKDAVNVVRYESTFAFPVWNADRTKLENVRAYDCELVMNLGSDGKYYLYDEPVIKENTASAQAILKEQQSAANNAAGQYGVSANNIAGLNQNVNMQDSAQGRASVDKAATQAFTYIMEADNPWFENFFEQHPEQNFPRKYALNSSNGTQKNKVKRDFTKFIKTLPREVQSKLFNKDLLTKYVKAGLTDLPWYVSKDFVALDSWRDFRSILENELNNELNKEEIKGLTDSEINSFRPDLVNAISAINDRDKNGKLFKWDEFEKTLKSLQWLYKNQPQLNYLTRLANATTASQKKAIRAEFEKMLSGINDRKALWYMSVYSKYATPASVERDIKQEQREKSAQRIFANTIEARRDAINEEAGLSSNIGMEVREYSLQEIEDMFRQLNTDEDLNALADKVFPVVEKLGLTIRGVPSGTTGSKTAGHAYGSVIEYNTKIFNGFGNTDQYKATALLHELIHGATSYALYAYEYPGWNIRLTPEMTEAVKKIRSVYNAVAADSELSSMYGAKNVHEMLAELANPKFREALEKKSLWDRIVDAFKQFFGIDTKNALDAASIGLDYLLDNFDYRAYLDYADYQNRAWQENYSVTNKAADAVHEALYPNMVKLSNDEWIDRDYAIWNEEDGVWERKSNEIVIDEDPIDVDGVDVYPVNDNETEIIETESGPVTTGRFCLDPNGITTVTYFAGAGTLDYAIKDYIYNLGAVEFDPEIQEAFIANNGNSVMVMEADVTKVNPYTMIKGLVEYFHASPVCKNFSRANNKAGEQEIDREFARSIVKALKAWKPKVFTLENVRGYQGSESLGMITDALKEAGYRFDIGVYRASDYGASTIRDRLFVRAVLEGELPEMPKKIGSKTWWSVVEDIVPELEDGTITEARRERLEKMGIDIENLEQPLLILSGTKGGEIQVAYADQPSPTLMTKGDEARIILTDGTIKKVSPRIYARIQGLDDDFILPKQKRDPSKIHQTNAFKIVGNGVPVELSRAVIEPLLDTIKRNRASVDTDYDVMTTDELLDLRASKQAEWAALQNTVHELESEFKEQYSKNKDIKAMKSWMDESGYTEAKTRDQQLSKELSDIWRAYETKRDQELEAEEIAAVEKSGMEEPKFFEKEAVKVFGYTPYFYDAGYILPNGKMLNFSGVKGKHFGTRGEDHRSIGQIFATTQGTDAMNRFINYGNVRIMGESPGIDISGGRELTADQYRTIRDFIRGSRNKGYFFVDITDENGHTLGTLEYDSPNAERIINDIKAFYETGEIREPSVVDQFHGDYSVDTEKVATLDDLQNEWAPMFYSKMENTINEWTNGKGQPMPERMSAQQVVGWLKGKGVKDEEIKWSGIVPYLEGKKTVTKDELLGVMAGNQVQIETKTLEELPAYVGTDAETGKQIMIRNRSDLVNTVRDLAIARGLNPNARRVDNVFYTYADDDLAMRNRIPILTVEDNLYNEYGDRKPGKEGTRWENYVLPNGKNYREILFKLPDLDYENAALNTHWDGEATGTIAHARVDDMTTEDGDRVLFVEEIQSDLHNAGAKQGFDGKENAAAIREMEKERDDADDKIAKWSYKAMDLAKDFSKKYNSFLDENEAWGEFGSVTPESMLSWMRGESEDLISHYFNIGTASNFAEKNKRALDLIPKLLSEEECEFIEEFRTASKKSRDLYRAVYHARLNSKAPDVPFAGSADTYHEYVMKHLLRQAAENGYDAIGWTTAQQQVDRWSDEYAEGYRIEYDQNIPKFMNKYTKQWGGKVQGLNLENGEEVWGVKLTPEMVNSVLYEGQPKFSIDNPVDVFGDPVSVDTTEVTNATPSPLSDQVFYADGNAYIQTEDGSTVVINNVTEDSPEAKYINTLETINNADRTATKPYTIPAATRNADDGYNLREQNAGLRRGSEEVSAEYQEESSGRPGNISERNEEGGSQSTEQESVKASLDFSKIPNIDFVNSDGEVVTSSNLYPIGSFQREVLLDIMSNNLTGLERTINVLWNKSNPPSEEVVSSIRDQIQINNALTDTEKRNLLNKLDEFIKEYGMHKYSQKDPKRRDRREDVHLPLQVNDATKTRKFVQTAARNAEREEFSDQALLAALREDISSYEPISDAKARQYAYEMLDRQGYTRCLALVKAKVESNEKLTKYDIALAEVLMKEAEAEGNYADALQLLADTAIIGTNAGQVVQAMSMIKKLTPRGQLYYMQTLVNRLNSTYEKAINDPKNKMNRIIIPDANATAVLTAKTKEEFDKAVEDLKQAIAYQIPATWVDKWNAWRYLAMLGNFRTHVRNLFGNGGFAPAVFIKDLIARELETHTNLVDPEKRSRLAGATFDKNSAYMRFAEENFKVMKDILSGEATDNKYTNLNEIMKLRKIWSDGPIGQFIKGASELNSKGLEKEDLIFLKLYYKRAFAEFLQARGVTEDQLNKDFGTTKETKAIMYEAQAWALREAQRNTYRDANAIASTLNQLKHKNKVSYVLLEGLVPFTKTPLNILNRGIEYSPIGLIQSLVNMGRDLRSGQYTTSEVIDRLAAGTTGTFLLTALGFVLAQFGYLRGMGPDDDKEREFDTLQGHQNWSIEIGNVSYTIDWMAPSALPLFVGCSIHDMLQSDFSAFTVWDIGTAIARIAEPLTALSMLDGLNSTLNSIATAQENSTLSTLAGSMLLSYISQGMPTIFGQAARSIDKDRRATYVDKNSTVPAALQKFIQKSIQSKVPWWESQKMAYVDEWGRTDSSDTVLQTVWKVFENFLSPGYGNIINTTAVDEEIQRLYEATKDNSVLPNKGVKYLTNEGERKEYTAKEYEEFSKVRGTTAFALLSEIFATSEYQELDDENKKKIIDSVYSYADSVAKREIVPELDFKSKWMETAQAIGPADYILIKSDIDDAKTNEKLFSYLASNPRLNESQIATIISQKYAAPDEVKSVSNNGYVYSLTEADEETMSDIFAEVVNERLAELRKDPSYLNADEKEQGRLINDLYSQAREDTKTLYGQMLDKSGRAMELGKASSVGKEAFKMVLDVDGGTSNQAGWLSDMYSADKTLNNPLHEGYALNLDNAQRRELKQEFSNAWNTAYKELINSKEFKTAPSRAYKENMIADKFNAVSQQVEDAYAARIYRSGKYTEEFGTPSGYTWGEAYSIATKNLKTTDEQAKWLAQKFSTGSKIDNPDRSAYEITLTGAQQAEIKEDFVKDFVPRYKTLVTSSGWNSLSEDQKQTRINDLQKKVTKDVENAYARKLVSRGYYSEELNTSASYEKYYTMLSTENLTDKQRIKLLKDKYVGGTITNPEAKEYRIQVYDKFIDDNYSKYVKNGTAAEFEKLHTAASNASGDAVKKKYGIKKLADVPDIEYPSSGAVSVGSGYTGTSPIIPIANKSTGTKTTTQSSGLATKYGVIPRK